MRSVHKSMVYSESDGPVSYTHLSAVVYAYKVLQNISDENKIYFAKLYRHKPVSYTHLDVYKRQPSYTGIIILTDCQFN